MSNTDAEIIKAIYGKRDGAITVDMNKVNRVKALLLRERKLGAQDGVRQAFELAEYDGKYDNLSAYQQLILKRYHYAQYMKLEELSRLSGEE